jgi:hypothetical protein
MNNTKGIESHNTELRDSLAARVLTVTEELFDVLALDIFAYQVTDNPVYQEYCRLMGKDTGNVRHPSEIPFLPISLFKTRDIHTNVWQPQIVFESSTTTGQIPSRHAVRDLSHYHQVAIRGFGSVMNAQVQDFKWIALLPSYTDRPNSSLVDMVSYFVKIGRPGSRFIQTNEVSDILNGKWPEDPIALISVSFALLDLAEQGPLPRRDIMIIETGGMKGRHMEPTRGELHATIQSAFGIDQVCSEYGMTELLSQGWSTERGIFQCGPTLRMYTREVSDPTTLQPPGTRGPLNCIDLANLDTCAFIATDDVGVVHPDGTFEVYGRLDASELRGCNLMWGEE